MTTRLGFIAAVILVGSACGSSSAGLGAADGARDSTGTGGVLPDTGGTSGALSGAGGSGSGGNEPGIGGIGSGGAAPGTGGSGNGSGGAAPGTGGSGSGGAVPAPIDAPIDGPPAPLDAPADLPIDKGDLDAPSGHLYPIDATPPEVYPGLEAGIKLCPDWFSQTYRPCCPSTPPDCTGKPDDYPGYLCTPDCADYGYTGQGCGAAWFACSCSHERWVCLG
jgi:hypothetical protein